MSENFAVTAVPDFAAAVTNAAVPDFAAFANDAAPGSNPATWQPRATIGSVLNSGFPAPAQAQFAQSAAPFGSVFNLGAGLNWPTVAAPAPAPETPAETPGFFGARPISGLNAVPINAQPAECAAICASQNTLVNRPVNRPAAGTWVARLPVGWTGGAAPIPSGWYRQGALSGVVDAGLTVIDGPGAAVVGRPALPCSTDSVLPCLDVATGTVVIPPARPEPPVMVPTTPPRPEPPVVTPPAGACTPGARRAAGDGCNNCLCTAAGSWACTDMACQIPEITNPAPGVVAPPRPQLPVVTRPQLPMPAAPAATEDPSVIVFGR